MDPEVHLPGGPLFSVRLGTERVVTRGTRSGAGCRPASRGLTLELVTQDEMLDHATDSFAEQRRSRSVR